MRLSIFTVIYKRLACAHRLDRNGMRQGLSAEIKSPDEAGPAQRAGPPVSNVLLSAAAPPALHGAVE